MSTSMTPDIHGATCSAVPDWHLPWIAEHARQIAQQTFLAAISDPLTIDPGIWETAGCGVIYDVHRALMLIEDPATAQRAALYGAEEFLRRFFDLLQTSGTVGRA